MNAENLYGPKPYRGFLFDMDGTLLTSIIAAERVWGRWAARHGLDVAAFLPTIHGKRTCETIRELNLPGIDPQQEADWITAQELKDTEGVEAIAGVREFIESLPRHAWAVVTSAPRRLALRRIEVAGLPLPEILIAAEDVQHGKPAPDCFLLGAGKLGVRMSDCLIFEDAPAGIQAAEASGADVVVIGATHEKPMQTPHKILMHYRDIAIDGNDQDGWRVLHHG